MFIVILIVCHDVKVRVSMLPIVFADCKTSDIVKL